MPAEFPRYPRPPNADGWYYSKGGSQVGPVAKQEIMRMLAANESTLYDVNSPEFLVFGGNSGESHYGHHPF